MPRRIKNLLGSLAVSQSAPLIVLLCLFVFFAPTLFSARTFFYRDLVSIHLSHKCFLAEALSGGGFPLWNPRLDMGMPYPGDPIAAPFYLPNALFLVLSAGAALKWFIVLHFVLAGLAACGLSLSLGNDGPGAALSGVAYALCGYLVGIHWNLPYLLSAAWLPVFLWMWHRGGENGFFPWRALAIPAGAALIIVGDPMAFVAVAVTLFFYVLFMVPARQWLKTAVPGAAVMALALAAAAIQVFPAYELYRESIRAGGLPWEEIARWSFEPKRLLEFVYPFFYQASLPWPASPAALKLTWVDTHYFGLVPLTLALFAFFRGRDRSVRWLALTGGFFLLLGMGGHTPVYRGLLSLLPWLQGFRYPEKYLVVAALAFCLLAGVGLKKFLERSPSRRLLSIPVLTLAAAVGSFFLIPRDSPARLLPQPNYPLTVHLTLIALAFLSLGWLAYRGTVAPATAAWSVVVLTAFDLAMLNRSLIPTIAEKDLLNPPPSVAVINDAAAKKSGPFRVFFDRRLQTGLPAGSAAVENADSTYWPKWFFRDELRLHPNSAWRYGLEYAQGYSTFSLREGYSLQPAKVREFDARLDLMNVRFIVTFPETNFREYRGYRTLATFPDAACRILENENALPRTYVLTTNSSLPYLGTGAGTPLPEPSALQLMPGAEAALLSYSNNEVRIRARLPEPGFLILGDRFFPGWHATVDGRPQDIRPFARFQRAVALAGGEHSVVFSYRSSGVLWGGLISCLTLLGVIVVGAAAARGRWPMRSAAAAGAPSVRTSRSTAPRRRRT